MIDLESILMNKFLCYHRGKYISICRPLCSTFEGTPVYIHVDVELRECRAHVYTVQGRVSSMFDSFRNLENLLLFIIIVLLTVPLHATQQCLLLLWLTLDTTRITWVQPPHIQTISHTHSLHGNHVTWSSCDCRNNGFKVMTQRVGHCTNFKSAGLVVVCQTIGKD